MKEVPGGGVKIYTIAAVRNSSTNVFDNGYGVMSQAAQQRISREIIVREKCVLFSPARGYKTRLVKGF